MLNVSSIMPIIEGKSNIFLIFILNKKNLDAFGQDITFFQGKE
jgi:hypothetical protein